MAGIKQKNEALYPYTILGQAIKERREAKGLTQDRASYLCDVGVSSYVGAENGYMWTSVTVYKKVCRFFKLNYLQLRLQDERKNRRATMHYEDGDSY